MIFIGDGDYQKIGDEFLGYFKEFGELKSNHKVLDVGCGIGRMSVPLTEYLSNEGEYYGFDIVEMGINWCKKNITNIYPNFNYEHSDIYNKMYNPKGVEKSSDYKFNYNDNFFDFVFLTSVFTHMHTQDINRYLEEISRVMKTRCRCLITFFLMNAESIALIKNKESTQNLIYKIDNNSFAKDKNIPESAIGFNEDYIKELLNKNGLNLIQPIHYGSWCGRNSFVSYQDIIVAEKK
ncbi:class I SAM-dependent methyltransferase [candidate division NPL-UPA2 bacterium Unc8]|uniref:Class I SAM-dependent methyltransferase n=1 Tax=candidate division NPL-UPA2 bacterium Unc8 TaxID=1980939 RepID=A0A399FU41_UNCN2|nr:MAG: class I SAM-dependent methyltransferase [candidate division NPL-UPA2 bacterium Unc8]